MRAKNRQVQNKTPNNNKYLQNVTSFYFSDILQFENLDTENLFSPVDYKALEKLLSDTKYNKEKTKYLVDGFRDGFDLGYRGPENIKLESKNLKFTIGNKTELWNKVMKEVQAKRYAGPFEQIPFENYIQSPIGLVPKDGGKKTRLIFHLSYPRKPNEKDLIDDKGEPIEWIEKSVNGNTPTSMTSVKYPDFYDAVKLCIKAGKGCYLGKSDMSSAFRHFAIAKKYWKFLVMKAQNPSNGKWYYFFDKCMPFGASISCAHFQEFSNAIAHIVTAITKKDNVNYLDDFFFVALIKHLCDQQVNTFTQVCDKIKFPVSLEKTFWGSRCMTFLGLLIDTLNQIICIPEEKIEKAKNMINKLLNKKSNKATVSDLQELTGFLNFLGKAVVPGRAFTRRLYSLTEKISHKPNHHVKLTMETKSDLSLWLQFLNHPSVYNRKFIDLDENSTHKEVTFYTDASANKDLGCGGYSDNDWFIMQWNDEFIDKFNPSINYLELYAVTIAVLNWINKYENKKITIFCDNMSVVQMVNNNSSKCKNCMVLIRIIVLQCLTHNVSLHVKHVRGKSNTFSDLLSRMKYKQFWQVARKTGKSFNTKPTQIPEVLQDMEHLWLCN